MWVYFFFFLSFCNSFTLLANKYLLYLLTNEQIRDQVIATCTSSKLRKRLLSETDLTLDKVLQIGKIMESAHHHNKEIETKAGSKSKDDYQADEEYLNYLKWKNRQSDKKTY